MAAMILGLILIVYVCLRPKSIIAKMCFAFINGIALFVGVVIILLIIAFIVGINA